MEDTDDMPVAVANQAKRPSLRRLWGFRIERASMAITCLYAVALLLASLILRTQDTLFFSVVVHASLPFGLALLAALVVALSRVESKEERMKLAAVNLIVAWLIMMLPLFA